MRSFTSRTVDFAIGRHSLGALIEHAVHITRLRHDLVVALLQRLEVRDHHLGNLLFQIAVAHAVEVGLHLFLGPSAEGLEDVQQVFDSGARRIEVYGRVGIRGRAHDLLADLVDRIKQRDGVACAGSGLAHFLVGFVQAHDARAHSRQMRGGHHESFAVHGIEALRDVARQLQVLRLIVAHRHDSGLVQQNVGCHQHRILQQSVADGFLRGGLRFVLRHALQPAHRRYAGQHPGELGVFRHRRLRDDRGLFRIDADSQEQRRGLDDFRSQLGRILIHRDGVQIHDSPDTLVIALDFHPVFQGSQVVANMQIAGWLHSREDAFFHV